MVCSMPDRLCLGHLQLIRKCLYIQDPSPSPSTALLPQLQKCPARIAKRNTASEITMQPSPLTMYHFDTTCPHLHCFNVLA